MVRLDSLFLVFEDDLDEVPMCYVKNNGFYLDRLRFLRRIIGDLIVLEFFLSNLKIFS